jgi:uncharacterized Zn finger protein
MKNLLTKTMTRYALLQQAGDTYFLRGEKYFKEQRVKTLTVSSPCSITATVQGTELYSVCIVAENDIFYGACSCPLGEEGKFCKHIVAAGLEFISRAEAETGDEEDSWETFIKNCPREELEQIVLEMTPNCPEIETFYRLKQLKDDPSLMLGVLQEKYEELLEIVTDDFTCMTTDERKKIKHLQRMMNYLFKRLSSLL